MRASTFLPLGLTRWDLWPCRQRALPGTLEGTTRGERTAMSATDFFRYMLVGRSRAVDPLLDLRLALTGTGTWTGTSTWSRG